MFLGRFIFRLFQPSQVADHLGERLAFDVLHGVEMDRPLAAHGKDRHDVRVVQLCRGLGLVLEPLELLRVQDGGER